MWPPGNDLRLVPPTAQEREASGGRAGALGRRGAVVFEPGQRVERSLGAQAGIAPAVDERQRLHCVMGAREQAWRAEDHTRHRRILPRKVCRSKARYHTPIRISMAATTTLDMAAANG